MLRGNISIVDSNVSPGFLSSRRSKSWCLVDPADADQAITSCNLDQEQGAYVISVETPVPLDLVLLHSAVHMDFLESDEDNEVGQVRRLST